MPARQTRYGTPLNIPISSAVSVLILEPTLGFALNQPETDLRPGQTPEAVNMLMREGAITLRPTLSAFTGNENPVGPITGGANIISSVGTEYPFVSGATRFAYYSAGSWSSPLSYVSAGGMGTPTSTDSYDFTDITQVYSPNVDENIAILGFQSYQTLLAWKSGTTTISSITSAPRARYVTTFDNFVMALNVRDVGSVESRYVQRVQWSDRGDPVQWDPTASNSLAGYEDLLDAKGEGTRLITLDDRVLIFFEDEIWQGVRATGASSFQFSAMDRTIGCPYPWTVTQTPLGVFFLGRDMMVYVIQKGSAAASPVGYPVQKRLRDRIDHPHKAWGVWDQATNTYQLWYPVRGGPSTAEEALFLNVGENSFAPQSLIHAAGELSAHRGFATSPAATTGSVRWSDISATGETWGSVGSTWGDMYGLTDAAARIIAVGTSSGTIGYLSNGTTDLGIPVEARWRSNALGGETPDRSKVLQELKIDYQASSNATVAIYASRDQGATFDPPSLVTLTQSAQQRTASAYLYTHAEYPTFEVRLSDVNAKLYRFWAQMRVGGR